MARGKSAADALRRAKEKGLVTKLHIVDGKPVHRKLEPGTERNYQRMMNLWYEFAHENPGSSAYDLKTLEAFMLAVGLSIDGAEGIPEACTETVRKYWNNFTAAWCRENPSIPEDIRRSITNFIKGPLTELLRLAKSKRGRRFATKNHLLHFARQMWMEDWFEYRNPATRIDDWMLHLSNTFSSSRIGEYIESSCRPDTGRGLYFREIIFGVFINEYGNSEFALQLTRDAKNMTDRPAKRPQHALYEGAVPMYLCLNPILVYLARLLFYGAFRDYDSVEEILSIVPPAGEMMQLYWREEFLDVPFFQSHYSERIETAASFSKRLRAVGFRAGYPRPPTPHDFRAEGLYWIDKFYSEATRMVHAGHSDSKTMSQHYMPTNGADGQDAYLGGKGRSLVLDLFRGLTVARNPCLWQCLPAEKQYELENKPEYLSFGEGIATLENSTEKESIDSRKKLYDGRRKLVEKELRNWQKCQPNKQDTSPGYHRAIFDRVRFMMPDRDGLARDLFSVDTLRSSTGLRALRALISIYQKPVEVEYRPGLEPEKCHCEKQNKTNSAPSNSKAPYDWKHIYTCYKRDCEAVSEFAEMCFQCNEWFLGKSAWEAHCETHLESLETFPIFCDPLMYGGVLATAGYCMFCLTKEDLPATMRLRQFLSRSTWRDHVHKHVRDLDGKKLVKCPHPRPYCATMFDSVLQLQFHLQDCHGLEYMRDTIKVKRPREDDKLVPDQRKKRKSHNFRDADSESDSVEQEYAFINITTKTMEDRRLGTLMQPSHCSTPICSLGSTLVDDESIKDTVTSPLTMCWEELIDPEILDTTTDPTSDAIEATDQKTFDNISKPKSPLTTLNLCVPDSLKDADDPATVTSVKNRKQSQVLRACTKAGIGMQNAFQGASPARHEDPTVVFEESSIARPPAIDPDDRQWAAERLISKKQKGRRVQYLVKWLGYPENESTWEEPKDIDPDMVAAFEAGLSHI